MSLLEQVTSFSKPTALALVNNPSDTCIANLHTACINLINYLKENDLFSLLNARINFQQAYKNYKFNTNPIASFVLGTWFYFFEKQQALGINFMQQAAKSGYIPAIRFIANEIKGNYPEVAQQYYILAQKLGCTKSEKDFKDLQDQRSSQARRERVAELACQPLMFNLATTVPEDVNTNVVHIHQSNPGNVRRLTINRP